MSKSFVFLVIISLLTSCKDSTSLEHSKQETNNPLPSHELVEDLVSAKPIQKDSLLIVEPKEYPSQQKSLKEKNVLQEDQRSIETIVEAVNVERKPPEIKKRNSIYKSNNTNYIQ